MVNKKLSVLVIIFSLLVCLSIVSATVTVQKETISSMAISEPNMPALYKLTITNLGVADTFTLSSLSGISIEPSASFDLADDETKEIIMKVTPKVPLKISPDYFSFEYTITGVKMGSQTEELALTYVNLKDAFNFNIEDITPDSEKAIINLENKAGYALDNINFAVSSLFFSNTQTLSLAANEKRTMEVSINKDKMRELLAGPYIVTATVNLNEKEASLSTVMNFKEQEGIRTTESSEGWIIQRYQIQKINEGNTKSEVTTIVSKNLISALFTSFNIAPDKKELSGLSLGYVFRKDLSPNQSLDVVAKTNWWILVVLIILLIIIYDMVDKYLKNKLVLKKRVSLVRTKGGEFALRVSITAKARDFIEKIRIYDRLPPMVKVFEKYGSINPDKIDTLNRRLEWNIQALGKGEERVMSYIVYSKIGVVGRFELPSVESVYEYNGKIKEARSNRAFFVNEPRVRKD